MADAWLRENPPARSQYRPGRRAKPTGCVVVHTAESVLDTVGPDTGAEQVAEFIRRRTDPGSYHDLVDSDSALNLVRYSDEAFQDGTGSNPWALSISFALKAADWPRLTPVRRDAFLRQGATAYARQQQWLRENRHPPTPLRRISRAQSEQGTAGFISHADRDPARRTDPGAGFPWTRFFELCAEALGQPATQEDDMTPDQDETLRLARADAANAAQIASELRNLLLDPTIGVFAQLGRVQTLLDPTALRDAVGTAVTAAGADVDETKLAAAIVAELGRVAQR